MLAMPDVVLIGKFVGSEEMQVFPDRTIAPVSQAVHELASPGIEQAKQVKWHLTHIPLISIAKP